MEVTSTSEIINVTENKHIDNLFNYYRENPNDALVYFNFKGRQVFAKIKIILTEKSNGEFSFIKVMQTFGISKTKKLYNSSKTISGIIYSNKKLWYKLGPNVRHLKITDIQDFSRDEKDRIMTYFEDKFDWFQFLSEESGFFSDFPLNRILTYKLTNKKKLLRHYIKAPYPVIENYMARFNPHNCISMIKAWRFDNTVLLNIHKLTQEFVRSKHYRDSFKMAANLGKTINCEWSLARLEEEHDKLTKENEAYLFMFMEERVLKVADIFKEFAEFSGYRMMLTNKDLYEEGKRKKHCVGDYESAVNYGNSGIYSVYDCTLELVKDGKGVAIQQYWDTRNTEPAMISKSLVKDKVKEFNKFKLEKHGKVREYQFEI